VQTSAKQWYSQRPRNNHRFVRRRTTFRRPCTDTSLNVRIPSSKTARSCFVNYHKETRCIAAYSLEHPRYSLVLVSNRDEFLARPTDPAHWHDDGNDSNDDRGNYILSGIDLLGHGTWLGITRSGRFGLLTNFTESLPKDSVLPSRGKLVQSWLSSTNAIEIDDFVNNTLAHEVIEKYAGFNLVLGKLHRNRHTDIALVTNRGTLPSSSSRILNTAPTGVVSNGHLDGPHDWPKVAALKHACPILSPPGNGSSTENEDDFIQALFDSLG
jgi:uncharacterized protein with NRDE domain